MSCNRCNTTQPHSFRRQYSADSKQMGRAMYDLLMNGPLDKSSAVLTVQEARDACSYCRTLVESDIRLLVYSYNPAADPANADDVADICAKVGGSE